MAEKFTRPVAVIAAFAASLALGLLVVVWLSGGLGNISATSTVGGPFQLTDQNGQSVTERSLQGKPTLMFFGFTHCPDVCPTALFEMSEILRALGPDAAKLNTYFVTVDPERDTTGVMKSYLSSFDPQLRGLTGSSDAIEKTLKAFRVYAKKVPLKDGDYTMDHTALVYLMDKRGNFVAPFNMKRTPQDAAVELKKMIAS